MQKNKAQNIGLMEDVIKYIKATDKGNMHNVMHELVVSMARKLNGTTRLDDMQIPEDIIVKLANDTVESKIILPPNATAKVSPMPVDISKQSHEQIKLNALVLKIRTMSQAYKFGTHFKMCESLAVVTEPETVVPEPVTLYKYTDEQAKKLADYGYTDFHLINGHGFLINTNQIVYTLRTKLYQLITDYVAVNPDYLYNNDKLAVLRQYVVDYNFTRKENELYYCLNYLPDNICSDLILISNTDTTTSRATKTYIEKQTILYLKYCINQ